MGCWLVDYLEVVTKVYLEHLVPVLGLPLHQVELLVAEYLHQADLWVAAADSLLAEEGHGQQLLAQAKMDCS